MALLPTGSGGISEELWGPIQAEMDALQEEMARIQREKEDLYYSTQPPEFPDQLFPGSMDRAERPRGTASARNVLEHEKYLPLRRALPPSGEIPVPKIDLPPGVASDFEDLFRLGEGKTPDRKHIDVIRAILAGDPEMRGALEDMERPDLSRAYGRPRYESATGVMVKVPPQLRGKYGFSDDPIQKVHPELAAMIPELKRKASEEDALGAFESGETSRGRAILPAELGPEQSFTAPISGSGGYRFVPPSLADVKINIPIPPGHDPAKDPPPSPSNKYTGDRGQTAAMFDPRFWMVSPTTGRVIPRGDADKQYEEAMAGGDYMPSVARGLGAGFTHPPGYDDRRKMWLRARDKARDTKESRLRSRRKLNHMKAMAQHNVADQMRANQPAWINVPRFPGESDGAYAARYAAFAQMMGQRMGRQNNYPGGDNNAMMGPMLQYILGMQQGETGERAQRRTILMGRIESLNARIDVLDAAAVFGGTDTDGRDVGAKSKSLRSQRDKLQRELDGLSASRGGRGGRGGGFNPFGGGY